MGGFSSGCMSFFCFCLDTAPTIIIQVVHFHHPRQSGVCIAFSISCGQSLQQCRKNLLSVRRMGLVIHKQCGLLIAALQCYSATVVFGGNCDINGVYKRHGGSVPFWKGCHASGGVCIPLAKPAQISHPLIQRWGNWTFVICFRIHTPGSAVPLWKGGLAVAVRLSRLRRYKAR